MTNRLTKLANEQYFPEVVGVVGRPAYCTTRTVVRAVTTYVYSETTVVSNGSVVITRGTWRPVTRYRRIGYEVCYPAIPAVEAQDAYYVIDNQPGWNAGAKSVKTLLADVVARFEYNPGGSGMLCGLANPGVEIGAFSAVKHGLLGTAGGTIRVVENGSVVADSGIDLDTSPSLMIIRLGTHVQYHVNDWMYTSAQPSTGGAVLASNMYLAGDYIDNPAFSAAKTLSGASDWEWGDWQYGNALRGDADWGWDASGVLNDGVALLTIDVTMAAGDHDYGAAYLTLDAPEITAEGGFPVVLSSYAIVSVPTIMTALAVNVDLDTASMEVPVDIVAGDYDFGVAELDAGGFSIAAWSFDEPEGTGTGSELMFVSDTYTTDPVIYAAINSTMTVGDTFDVIIAIDAALAEYLFPSDAISAAMVLEALLKSNVGIADSASTAQAAALQYVTSLLTGASWRYDGYDFRGFCTTGDYSFGWKSNGVYRLGEIDDDGSSISAMINFAAQDFNTTGAKRLKAVYFGIATDGLMYAKLTDDRDNEVTYRVDSYGDQARLMAQRRQSSRFWRLQLQIVDATYAELDNIEWVAASSGRRLTR